MFTFIFLALHVWQPVRLFLCVRRPLAYPRGWLGGWFGRPLPTDAGAAPAVMVVVVVVVVVVGCCCWAADAGAGSCCDRSRSGIGVRGGNRRTGFPAATGDDWPGSHRTQEAGLGRYVCVNTN